MAAPTRRTPAGARPGGRRRASHSLEAVIGEAVALLDEAGEPALTFRALAARLGGGVASIYWYVANKDELLDRATDHVLAGVLVDTEAFAGSPDPIDDLRSIAVSLFGTIVERPWLAAYFMRDTGTQPNGLLLYERIGQQVLRLGLTPRQSFHAVSAILGFAIGIAADLGQQPPQEVLDGTVGRDEYLSRYADQWRGLDPASYPFLHEVVDEFEGHDDADQFRAGLDLLLAGLRLQAEQAR
ncbi:TetR/AcrR family transcriptional regulator [Pimelobacter simplex]|uniref:TetR/AcrR family transcriptional regulator n=1 Tax=Nocardioides simplex TaxID=2045 RepID=UPI00214F7CE3|nr:TetR/AcrR family transcriptional regulator C-terminal domain-containing protein [Pimelobacter simplex]UUW90417.1 TetR/AcrR family transcriptional regulator C-terminal domain-containing protein [Pimelobacter simplex]UUW94247.1 TetR/AcrR family transcriptional regulator C-terminal domain-containing protein [Pimelobacter simplex]